jgi:hypothetical protein
MFTWPGIILQENTAILLLVLASSLDSYSSQSIFKTQDIFKQNIRGTEENNTSDSPRMKKVADHNIVRVENVISKEIAIVKIIFKE